MRSLRLVKYLANFGWQALVITTDRGYDQIHGSDPSLLQEIPDNMRVLRVADPIGRVMKILRRWLGSSFMYQIDRLSKVLFFPDEKIIWGILAYFMLKKELNGKTSSNLIYATGFPWTSFLVGRWLAKELKLPMVIDFRDAWSLNPTPLWRMFKLHGFVERKLIGMSQKVIFATKGLCVEYQKKYPFYSNKLLVINNGFDPDKFPPEAMGTKVSMQHSNSKINIIYAGSLSDTTPPKLRSRSLIPLLGSLADIRQHDNYMISRLTLDVYSNDVPNTRSICQRLKLEDIVCFKARVSHDKIIEKMLQADILLLIIMRDVFSKYITTAKLYEYIAVGKPILAIAPKYSEAVEIIKHYKLGMTVDYDNIISGLTEALHTLLSRPDNSQLNRTLSKAHTEFNGVNLVKKFAQVFGEVCV